MSQFAPFVFVGQSTPQPAKMTLRYVTEDGELEAKIEQLIKEKFPDWQYTNLKIEIELTKK